ncbi:MAG: redoxin family protein [Acidobacteriia bacterium]|nr:redoxin family protein [Terriglobia bacterium]
MGRRHLEYSKRKRLSLTLILFVLVSLLGSMHVIWSADGTFEELLEQGQAQIKSNQFTEAVDSFLRANRMKNDGSVDCWIGISQGYRGLNMYDEAIQAADRALKCAPDDTWRARAHLEKGLAIIPKVDLILEYPEVAETEFLAAINLNPNPPLPAAHYYLGQMLLKDSKAGAAVEHMKLYVQAEPQGGLAAKARQVIDRNQFTNRTPANTRSFVPSRRDDAPAFLIPDFSFRTMQGQTFNKQALQGKMVLFDFWASWCGPCRASLPQLQQLHDHYARDDRFVLISISADRSERTWRDFVERAGMDWPQFFDRDLRLNRAFNITSYPTYLLVAQDGSVLLRFSGWSGRRDEFLHDEIDRRLKTGPNTP